MTTAIRLCSLRTARCCDGCVFGVSDGVLRSIQSPSASALTVCTGRAASNLSLFYKSHAVCCVISAFLCVCAFRGRAKTSVCAIPA